MLGCQVILRLEDGRVIAPSVAARRRVARVVARQAERFGIVAFRCVDHHLHANALCSREEAGRLAQALGAGVQIALGPGARCDRASITPVNDQTHLVSQTKYILRNNEKHGVGVDPWHDGSSLADMLGLRVLEGGIAARAREHLPRATEPELVRMLGVAELQPGFAAEHLADAAAAAVALPDLRGRGTETLAARAAAARVAGPHLPRAEIAARLGVRPRAVAEYLAAPPEPALEGAIALQMGLRIAVPPPARPFATRDVDPRALIDEQLAAEWVARRGGR